MKENDGGAAFPYPYGPQGAPGMSLRDWFAGLAMQGFRANEDGFSTDDPVVAKWSYEQADAMLAERAK